MKPIIIDAATIFDPARLIAVLASVDIRYSEVWVSQTYDHFKEKDYLTGLGTDSRIGLLPDSNGRYKAEPLRVPTMDEELNPKDVMTGPKILRWAVEKGIVIPKDLSKYEKLAIDLEEQYKISNLSEAIMLGPPFKSILGAEKEVTEKYLTSTVRSSLGPELAWRWEPYGNGRGLGLILAAAQEENVEPFFSHPNFQDQVSTHNYMHYQKEKYTNLASNEDVESVQSLLEIKESLKTAKRLLECRELITLKDVAFYLSQKERVDKLSGIISASKDLESRPRDVGIIFSKYLGTLTIDTTIFGGLPITSTLSSIYDIRSRWLKSKK